MLELDEGQLSRPVLRGRGGSNTSLLPDLSVSGSSQRGRVCARPDPSVLAGSVGRGAREEWPVAREHWPLASETEEAETTVTEKRQNKANYSVSDRPSRLFSA